MTLQIKSPGHTLSREKNFRNILRSGIDQLNRARKKNDLWDSARNADMEYVPGVTYTVTLDGFIISDNIECVSYEDINTGYSYSDHDPVYLKFRLK